MVEPYSSFKLFRLNFKRSQDHNRNISLNAKLDSRVIVLRIEINMYWWDYIIFNLYRLVVLVVVFIYFDSVQYVNITL